MWGSGLEFSGVLLDPAANTPATLRLTIFQARRPCASVQPQKGPVAGPVCSHSLSYTHAFGLQRYASTLAQTKNICRLHRSSC